MATTPVEQMTRRAGDELNASEQYRGAQGMTIKGRNALAVWAAGADAREALPNLVSSQGEATDLNVEDDAVPNAFIAAVTDQRLLIFGRSIGGKPKNLALEYPLGECTLDAVDVGDRARSRIFVFSTADGSVFASEVAINGKALESADEFVAAWQAVQPQALAQ